MDTVLSVASFLSVALAVVTLLTSLSAVILKRKVQAEIVAALRVLEDKKRLDEIYSGLQHQPPDPRALEEANKLLMIVIQQLSKEKQATVNQGLRQRSFVGRVSYIEKLFQNAQRSAKRTKAIA